MLHNNNIREQLSHIVCTPTHNHTKSLKLLEHSQKEAKVASAKPSQLNAPQKDLLSVR